MVFFMMTQIIGRILLLDPLLDHNGIDPHDIFLTVFDNDNHPQVISNQIREKIQGSNKVLKSNI